MLKEAVVEHRVRLENGVAVFGKTNERIAELEQVTKPKPPRIITIVGVTISIVTIAAGALWALSSMLNDRPTVKQIDRIIQSHDVGGHSKVRNEVRAVQIEQGKQRVIIESVKADQGVIRAKQDDSLKKLDTLINRTPDRRHR